MSTRQKNKFKITIIIFMVIVLILAQFSTMYASIGPDCMLDLVSCIGGTPEGNFDYYIWRVSWCMHGYDFCMKYYY